MSTQKDIDQAAADSKEAAAIMKAFAKGDATTQVDNGLEGGIPTLAKFIAEKDTEFQAALPDMVTEATADAVAAADAAEASANRVDLGALDTAVATTTANASSTYLDSLQTAADVTQTATNRASAEAASVSAAASADAAQNAKGIFPTTAKALSKGVASLSGLTAGSGGANGTFALAFSGGAGSKAAGWFTVAGGIVTAYGMSYPGYDYTSAPTISFSASAGLTGASLTAVISQNVTDGQYFNIPDSADSGVLQLWQNVSGTATDTGKRSASTQAVQAVQDNLDARLQYIPGVGLAIIGADGFAMLVVSADDIRHPKIRTVAAQSAAAQSAADAAIERVAPLSLVAIGDGFAVVGADGYALLSVTTSQLQHPVVRALRTDVDTALSSADEALTLVTSAVDQQRPAITSSSGLRRFFGQLGDAEHQVVRVNVFGDSNVYGAYCDAANGGAGSAAPTDDVADVLSFSGVLRTAVAQTFGAPEAGHINGGDSRVGVTGTAAKSSTGVDAVGVARYSVKLSAADTATFSVPDSTTLELFWYENGGADGATSTGSFSYAVDGGSAVVVTNGGGAVNYRSVEITGLASGAHTVVVTGVSGTCYVCGIDYHSGRGVLVRRVGRNGWTSADFVGKGARNNCNAAGQARMLKAVSAYRADLTVYVLGRNNATYKNMSEAQPDGRDLSVANYLADMQALTAQSLTIAQSILLLAETAPSDDTSAGAGGVKYKDYYPPNDTIALANDFVSALRMTDMFGLYSDLVALGLLTSAHFNRKGCGHFARWLSWLLFTRLYSHVSN